MPKVMDIEGAVEPKRVSRDAIKEIWGPRTPYKHVWPTRVDEMVLEEPESWVQSACVLCSNGCGMDIGVKEGKVVAVRGRATDRVNHGRLGPKGLHGWTSISHPDRLKYPQIRKNGRLERATWDEAMDLIVAKAKAVRKDLTAHGIGFYTSGQLFLEEYYALAIVGKAGLCTLHMDGNTRLCTATAAASMRENFGSDGQPGSYTDIDYTDCILMVGHNMSATQTVLWSRILDRLAGPDPPKLIVIDPRLSNSARAATLHLTPRIGTNLALLNGIQHCLFHYGYIDERFISEHTVGIEKLRETVKMSTPSRTEHITSVKAHLIEEAAHIIGKSTMLLSTCLQGVYQSNQATASACAVNNINLLLGRIGKPGSGIFQMNGQPTAQNNRESGCDGEYPGFRNQNNPNHMQELADIWNIDFERLPKWADPTHIQNMLNYIQGGTIEMFWISGTNPLVSLPNLPRVRELLTKPELFVVAQDIFPNETTAIADVVLPAAQWGEKTGCFTNVDRTVHLSHKAVEPPGEAKSDLDIFVDFSNRMDFRDKDGAPLIPWTTPEEGLEAFKKLTFGRPCDYSGLSYQKLTGGSGIQWPCTEKYPNGKERLFDDGVFFTDVEYCESFGHDLETGAPYSRDEYMALNPAGRAIFKACHYIPDPESTSEEYPLALSTGRNTFHFHTRTKTGRSKRLQEAAPEPEVVISEFDAEQLGIKHGEMVSVKSRRGEIQVSAFVGEISRGQTFIPFHFGYFDAKDDRSRAANELTEDRWDPISKQPVFKGGAVKITRCKDQKKVQVPQSQSASIDRASKEKPDAEKVRDGGAYREHHLSLWLGATEESIKIFAQACVDQLPKLVHDQEVVAGLTTLHRISTEALDDLRPHVEEYKANTKYGRAISTTLGEALFPWKEQKTATPYGTLATLQGLHIYLANTQGHLVALLAAAQALWDKEFVAAVESVQTRMKRCIDWVNAQISVRAPQTLIVPSRNVWNDAPKGQDGESQSNRDMYTTKNGGDEYALDGDGGEEDDK